MPLTSAPASSTFALIKPFNAAAKLAFSLVSELISGRQDSSPHNQYMVAETEQKYDGDVFKTRVMQIREEQSRTSRRTQAQNDQDDADRESTAEPDSDVEEDLKSLGNIFVGYYTLDINCPPRDPHQGWVMGSAKDSEFVITTERLKDNIKPHHVLLNFNCETGFVTLVSKASRFTREAVKVGAYGVDRGSMYAFNQTPAILSVGSLEYSFEFTDFAYTEEFGRQRKNHAEEYLGVDPSKSTFALTQTPTKETMTFGTWTINTPLGRGTFGRVHSATDTKNNIVAIKIVVREQESADMVDNEIRTLKRLTCLAEAKNDEGRLVHLHDVLYRSGKAEWKGKAPFEELGLILRPCVRGTFSGLVAAAKKRLVGPSETLTTVAMKLYRDLLLGVDFMHDNKCIHGDLKPSNIGIDGDKAVILDIGGSKFLDGNAMLLSASDNQPGTVAYLAPERDWHYYNYLADVWSVGVIGFELVFGYHPWPFTKNPWHPDNEELEPDFFAMYRAAMAKMERATRGASQKTAQMCELLLMMLRFQCAQPEKYRKDRITIKEALAHRCWELLGDGEPARKKGKLSSKAEAKVDSDATARQAEAVAEKKKSETPPPIPTEVAVLTGERGGPPIGEASFNTDHMP